MKIGVLYSDIKIVEEVFQLLKIPWEQYTPEGKYDVVIAHKSAIPEYKGVIIDLTIFNIFLRIDELLNNGKSNLHIPECDIILEDLRNQLKQYVILVEISPSPWSYPYMVALTHDVDFTSIRECRLTTVGYAAFQCFKQLHFLSGLRLKLAKFGIGQDPWNLFKYWEQLENNMGVRSTFFFVPKKGDPGQHAHPYRAINYTPDKTILSHLIVS